MRPLKILHLAPFNTANVPLSFVRAERALGHESRLVTLHRHRFGYEEDISLNLPFMESGIMNVFRRFAGKTGHPSVFEMVPGGKALPLRWQPGGAVERLFHSVRDRIWEPYIRDAWRKYDLDSYDLYQLDGGLGFLRSGKFMRKLSAGGKKIICCYLGSDLRRRGIIPEIDRISFMNFTVEFDLKMWYPGINYVPFPFNADELPEADPLPPPPFIIGHAPSNRAAKGSELIINAIRKLAETLPVSLLLIEGKPYKEAIALKSRCHIFIDQLGPLGYGINTLEALAMGIPACSSLAPGFRESFPGNPIIEISPGNIGDVISNLVANHALREETARRGKEWVGEFHDARNVVRAIHEYVFGN